MTDGALSAHFDQALLKKYAKDKSKYMLVICLIIKADTGSAFKTDVLIYTRWV